MTQAKEGDTVKVHYTGKLNDGTVFDSSDERSPIEFTIGEGQVIPGFEEAVVGMEPGESKTTTVPAEKAYGPHQNDMLFEVEREQFPQDVQPEAGQQLQIRQPDGRAFFVTVSNVSESSVTLDANHPLAGKELVFDIRLEEIVPAESVTA